MEDFKEEKRVCPYSSEEFVPKRHNQRFAYPSYRIAFHNNANNEIRRARAFVDNKLHKNYSILLELLNGKQEGKFHKEFLNGKGYSFNVLTHYELYEGSNRQAVYDFIILYNNSEVIILRKK